MLHRTAADHMKNGSKAREIVNTLRARNEHRSGQYTYRNIKELHLEINGFFGILRNFNTKSRICQNKKKLLFAV